MGLAPQDKSEEKFEINTFKKIQKYITEIGIDVRMITRNVLWKYSENENAL